MAVNNLFDLSGRRAIVTGASRGIGLAIARGLARQGAAVVITGRKLESLSAAAAQLRAEGAHAEAMVCHQGDPAAIKKLFESTRPANRPRSLSSTPLPIRSWDRSWKRISAPGRRLST